MSNDERDDDLFVRPPPQIRHAAFALERFLDPDTLEQERARFLNDEPPPPYSEAGSTTATPSPYCPGVELELNINSIRRVSRPRSQFDMQTTTELERLYDQNLRKIEGFRLTLPFDDTMSFHANADNNVRQRWLDLGIWAKEWGPAWPPSTKELRRRNGRLCDHSVPDQCYPFCNTTAGAIWAHEHRNLSRELQVEAQPSHYRLSSSPQAQDQKLPETLPASGSVASDTRVEVASSPIPQPSQFIDPRIYEEITVPAPNASRPRPFFLTQVEWESRWIQDDGDYRRRHHGGPEINAMDQAHRDVKARWRKSGIWNADWGDAELPGERWAHEAYTLERMKMVRSQEAQRQKHITSIQRNKRKRKNNNEPLFTSKLPPGRVSIFGPRQAIDETTNQPITQSTAQELLPRRSARIAKMQKDRITIPERPPSPSQANTTGARSEPKDSRVKRNSGTAKHTQTERKPPPKRKPPTKSKPPTKRKPPTKGDTPKKRELPTKSKSPTKRKPPIERTQPVKREPTTKRKQPMTGTKNRTSPRKKLRAA